MSSPRRMVLGISGATGIAYGVRLLEVLKAAGVETHLVMTKSAEMTAAFELDITAREIRNKADVNYSIHDVGAAIASGSYRTMGMIVAPCTMNTLAEIATGSTSNLLTRAADVCLKERRRLVLMAREAPLHAGHLRSMLAVTENGGIIVPPVPAFYPRPTSIAEIIDQTIGRVLDLFDLDPGITERWREGRTSDLQALPTPPKVGEGSNVRPRDSKQL